MPLNTSDTSTYRRDVATKGSVLTAKGRANLIEPYLPRPEDVKPRSQPLKERKQSRLGHKKRIRPFLKDKLYFLIYFLIQLVYGIFIRFQQFYHALCDRIVAVTHYHHRTPEYIEKDVSTLSRVPGHLSVILKYRVEEDGGLDTLMDEVAELSAWSTAAGIPLLSIYEKTGTLKKYKPALEDLVSQKLASYFGTAPPSLRVYARNQSSHAPSPASSPRLNGNGNGSNGHIQKQRHLDLLLLSYTDGRDTLVDLTRTLTEMAQTNKIRPKDITSELINTEIVATTAIPGSETHANESTVTGPTDLSPGEPDLVMVFGPRVKLDGYPPWQIRLSEIFCVGGEARSSSTRVEYQGFLRGLWKFAGAEMRFGR